MKKLTFIIATLFIIGFTSCGNSELDEIVDQEQIDENKSADNGSNEGDPHTGGPG